MTGAPGSRERPAAAVRGRQPHQRPDPRLCRAHQAPGAGRFAGRGPHAEDVAEDDLLDTAWVQRLRRISQLQSARWVFPTAEHSRFTHGLGVMHEAGLWARSLYPSAARRAAGARRPASRSRPRAWSSRRCGSRACSTTSGMGRSRTSSTSGSSPRIPAPADPRRPGAKTLSHEDLSQLVIERELGPLIRGLRRAPGAVPERDRFAEGEAIDPRWVSFLVSKPPLVDAAMPAWVRVAPAAAVGRVHGRQPRLRPARRVPHGRLDGAGRRGAAAPLRVRLRARAHALRVGRRRARDVPDGAPVHVPARVPASDGAGDRPRPGRGVRAVDPRRVRRRLAGRAARARSPTSTSTRCCTRPRCGRAASGVSAVPVAGRRDGHAEIADGWRAILLRRPRWRAEHEVRARGRDPRLARGDPRASWATRSRAASSWT